MTARTCGRAGACAVIAWVLAASAAGAGDAPWDRPFQPMDFIPPEWTEFRIEWRDSWAGTLLANDEKAWAAQAEADARWKQAAGMIVPLRRIRLYEEMVKRWPQDPVLRLEALHQTVRAYQQLDRRAEVLWYGWQALQATENDAWSRARPWSVLGSGPRWDRFAEDPAMTQWAPVIPRAIEGMLAGGMSGHRALWPPIYRGLNIHVIEDRYYYERACEWARRIQAAARNQANADLTLSILLGVVGQPLAAGAYAQKAGGPRGENAWMWGLVTQAALITGQSTLEAEWKDMERGSRVRGPVALGAPGLVGKLLRRCAQEGMTARVSDGHAVSYWGVLDGEIAGLGASSLGAVREAQQKEAQPAAYLAGLGGDNEELMRLFRQFPWAQSVQDLLAERGEEALLRGHGQWAWRAFDDVRRHAADPVRRGQAILGLWLAIAQEDARGPLVEAMADVPDATPIPWHGQSAQAGQVKKAILAALAPGGADQTAPAETRRRTIRLPASWYWRRQPRLRLADDAKAYDAWPVSQVERRGGRLAVWAQGCLARYEAGAVEAAWARIAQTPPLDLRNTPALREPDARMPWWLDPTPRPVATGTGDDDPVICRLWELPSTEGAATVVAGFDAAGGQLVWTTAGDPTWRKMRPLTAPALAEGRAYVLAAETPEPLVHLVCLDARSGRTLWSRPLGMRPPLHELADRGRPVSVRDGAVYCGTNLGFLARCDLRDGMVEWLATYRAWSVGVGGCDGYGTRLPSMLHTREGSSPLVTDDLVILAPRDHGGVLAYDRRTGQPRWEKLFVPVNQLVGLAGGAVVLKGGLWAGALDGKTGEELWRRTFDRESGPNAVLAGEQLLVPVGDELLRLSPQTGQTIRTEPLAAAGPDQRVLLPDGTVLEITEPLPPVRVNPPAAAGSAKGTMVEVWTLPRSAPTMWLPDGPALPGAFCLTWENRIARIERGPTYRLAWEKTPPVAPRKVHLTDSRIALADRGEIACLNPADGALRWRTPVPMRVELFGGSDRYVWAAHPWTECCLAVLNAADGKLLWHRCFNGVRFQRTASSPAISFSDPGAPAPAAFRILRESALFPDGWRPAEFSVDAATGRPGPLGPFQLPDPQGWPRWLTLRPDRMAYLAHDGRVRVMAADARTDLAPEWQGRITSWNPSQNSEAFEIYSGAARPAVRAFGDLWIYDPVTRRTVTYETAPPTFPSATCRILAYRETGAGVWVVSTAPDVAQAQQSLVFVTVFDSGSGKALSRHQLPGLSAYAAESLAARFLDEDLLVTDPVGLHLFRAARP